MADTIDIDNVRYSFEAQEYFQRQLEEESDDERIQISTEQVDLRDFDELGSTHSVQKVDDSIILDDIEELV